MTRFVALLRAINVGGTGKLSMSELVKLCENAGLENAKTYIQSGNVVFDSRLTEIRAKNLLEEALEAKLGKPVGVILRNPTELEAVLGDNPFPTAPPNRVVVFFYEKALPEAAVRDIVTPGNEAMSLHGRELYVHYPDGQGRSKLKVPNASTATGRNLNTVAKLAAMATT